MRRNTDRTRRLEALERKLAPPLRTLADCFPDLDADALGNLAGVGMDVANAAVSRLGIEYLPHATLEHQELVDRAIGLAVNEYADRIRAGDRTRPPRYGEWDEVAGRSVHRPAIEDLLIKVGWKPTA